MTTEPQSPAPVSDPDVAEVVRRLQNYVDDVDDAQGIVYAHGQDCKAAIALLERLTASQGEERGELERLRRLVYAPGEMR